MSKEVVNRVLFLDIDGVLNSETYSRARYGRKLAGQKMKIASLSVVDNIDPTALFCLYEQLNDTEHTVDVVLSSTWNRVYSGPELDDEFYRVYGIRLNIISSTKDMSRSKLLPTARELSDIRGYIHKGRGCSDRGYQITNWLGLYPEYDIVAVVDDGSDIPESILVKTDYRTGFNALTCDVLKEKLKL